VGLVLIAYFVLQILFGGLRGSRSNIIWALFWAVGIIHLRVRPISRTLIYVGLLFLVAFMYFYGFYKGAGLDAVRAFDGAEARVQLTQKTRRSLETVVLGDLARSDVQAFLLFALLDARRDYQYAFGRTYLGAVAMFIPKAIWPDRPAGAEKEGTEMEEGTGSYQPGRIQSSHVFGLAGEAMLNFGFLSVPVAFLLLGQIVGRVRRCLLTWDGSDARSLFLPLLVIVCFVILLGGFQDVLGLVLKNGTLPALAILLSSRRFTLPAGYTDVPVTGRGSSSDQACVSADGDYLR
jgi:hypothetical protein